MFCVDALVKQYQGQKLPTIVNQNS